MMNELRDEHKEKGDHDDKRKTIRVHMYIHFDERPASANRYGWKMKKIIRNCKASVAR